MFGTETHVEVQLLLLAVLGAAGRIRSGTEAHALAGEVEHTTRQGIVNTFGGGVNEVLRDMVPPPGSACPDRNEADDADAGWDSVCPAMRSTG